MSYFGFSILFGLVFFHSLHSTKAQAFNDMSYKVVFDGELRDEKKPTMAHEYVFRDYNQKSYVCSIPILGGNIQNNTAVVERRSNYSSDFYYEVDEVRRRFEAIRDSCMMFYEFGKETQYEICFYDSITAFKYYKGRYLNVTQIAQYVSETEYSERDLLKDVRGDVNNSNDIFNKNYQKRFHKQHYVDVANGKCKFDLLFYCDPSATLIITGITETGECSREILIGTNVLCGILTFHKGKFHSDYFKKLHPINCKMLSPPGVNVTDEGSDNFKSNLQSLVDKEWLKFYSFNQSVETNISLKEGQFKTSELVAQIPEFGFLKKTKFVYIKNETNPLVKKKPVLTSETFGKLTQEDVLLKKKLQDVMMSDGDENFRGLYMQQLKKMILFNLSEADVIEMMSKKQVQVD